MASDDRSLFQKGLHPVQLFPLSSGPCVPEMNELLPLYEQLAAEVKCLLMVYVEADSTLQTGGHLAIKLEAGMQDVGSAYGRLAQAHQVLKTKGPKRRSTEN